MQYGPHHEDVQDVLDFLDQRALLRRPGVLRDEAVKLIGDVADIERYQRLPEDVDEFCDAMEWMDIRRTAGTGVHNLFPKDESNRKLRLAFFDLWRTRVRPLVVDQLVSLVPEQHAEDIAMDFRMFMDFRAAFGRSVRFIERLLDLYKAGGYPCGWDGLYPEGRIVVYHPDAPR